MSIRNLFQGKPVAGVVVVVVLVAASVWIASRQKRVIGPTYYDLQTGELFEYTGEELPPVVAPSGGEGVVAHVFACGSCDDEQARFIGYLEKYTDEGKAQVRRTAEAIAASTKDSPPPPQMRPERVISAFVPGEPPRWINALDPVAVGTIGNVRQRCVGKGSITQCHD
jgi:hypothetical protein